MLRYIKFDMSRIDLIKTRLINGLDGSLRGRGSRLSENPYEVRPVGSIPTTSTEQWDRCGCSRGDPDNQAGGGDNAVIGAQYSSAQPTDTLHLMAFAMQVAHGRLSYRSGGPSLP